MSVVKLTLALLLISLTASTRAEDSLANRLRPIIGGYQGKVAVSVKHLESGESFLENENDPMPTASLIKFPVMIETFRRAEEKTLDLSKMVVLKDSEKVRGAGVLTYHFSEGATFPLRDAVRLMIVYSDNTATNLVLDEIGLASTAKTMEAWGYPHTKIHAKVFRRETSVFPERSAEFGLGSTTASEMLRLLEKLHRKELVSRAASESMLNNMSACEDPDKFPRFLPPGTKLAFKTGSSEDIRTAAGILYGPTGPVALCVLSKGHPDKRYVPDNAGNRLCADVAKAVFDYYSARKAATTTSNR